MKYLLTILLGIVITISYRAEVKPDAPVEIQYNNSVYYHKFEMNRGVSGDYLIISIHKYSDSKNPVKVYIYSLKDIYGFDVKEE